MSGWRAAFAVQLLSIAATGASAQRPREIPPAASPMADSVSTPFIPGGRWLSSSGRTTLDSTGWSGQQQLVLLSPDGVPYFERPNGLLLRPGVLVYRLSLRRDTATIALGIRTVTIGESMLGGVAGWLIAEARTGTPVATTDSLYLHRADLTPERWAATIGRTQLAVSFTADSMFAAVQDYQGRGSFSTHVPPGALISAGMIDRVIELLPLAPGYRSAASLVLVEAATPRVMPAEISVSGEEIVVLADRPVDCWVVQLRTEVVEKRYWVSKDATRVVKTEQWTPGGMLSESLEGG